MFDSNSNDEDDIFLAPASNLANVFGVPMQSTVAVNTNLTYTAPKQPDRDSPTRKKHLSSVLMFKEVQAFKLVDKNYTSIGKNGLVLIGNDEVRIYQLLLYKDKQNIFSTSKVSKFFKFVILKDNYSLFCDDEFVNWMVLFISDIDQTEFIQVLEEKGVNVIRNTNENAKVDRTTSPPRENTPPKTDTATSTHGTKQEITSENAEEIKAELLSRVAKMGQRILPNKGASDGSESDTDKDYKRHRKSKKRQTPESMMVIQPNNILRPSVSQQFMIMNGQIIPVAQQPEQSMPTTTIHHIQPPLMNPDQLNMLFTENRTHNSEVRMNLLRLTTKIEDIYEKVNKIEEKHPACDPNLMAENQDLKGRLANLDKRIVDLMQLNETLSKKNVEINKKITTFVNRIEDQQTQLDQQQTLIDTFEAKEKEYKDKIDILETTKEVLRAENYVKNQKPTGPTPQEKFKELDDTVKRIMNYLYQDINIEIDDKESVMGKDVKKIIAQKIIEGTNNVMKHTKK